MYQVLARKYRPKNFHQLLGQDHVANALINAINQQRLHHAYLFTGTRGVGKTTIARILAKCLNCETGITSEPCGVCSTCQAIDAGRFIDLIEIDAASRTKVEDTRELLDNVPYAPTQGRYKVYLIDEVHMLSTHSFNALLKTLEEPPEHVKFLLATTDPQKLPITIISRCLQFVLRPLPQPQLANYLGKILEQEHIEATHDALWQLASSAKGSVRDALSLTDQAIAFGNGKIGEDTLQQMLGLIDQADVIELLTLIYQQRTPEFAQALQQLRQQVVDAKAVFDRLADVLHQVALLQLLPDFDLQLQRQQQQALQQLAALLPAELVQLYYEIIVKSRENIALANTPAQALEMCLLRLLAFKPLASRQIVPPIPSRQTLEHNQTSTNIELSDDVIDVEKVETIAEEMPPQEGQNDVHDLTSEPNTPSLNLASHDERVDTDAVSSDAVSRESINNKTVDNKTIANETTNSEAVIVEAASETSSQPLLHPADSNQDILNPQVLDQNADNTENLEKKNDSLQITITETSVESPHVELSQLSHSVIHEPHLTASQTVDEELSPPSVELVPESEPESKFEPSVQQPTMTIASPLDLLQPSPQPLEGDWTVEKWDYWVAQARENEWLAEDELVLAKLGVMQGQIGGESRFVTDEKIFSHSQTFLHLQRKIQRQLSGTTVTLDTLVSNSQFIIANKPESLQKQRDSHALAVATQKIAEQPVMQALLQQNASISVVKFNRN